MNILNKTESAVFLYCRFSLFLKDPLFRLIRLFVGGGGCEIEFEYVFYSQGN